MYKMIWLCITSVKFFLWWEHLRPILLISSVEVIINYSYYSIHSVPRTYSSYKFWIVISYILWLICPHIPHPQSLGMTIWLCFRGFDFFWYHMPVRPCGSCLSESGYFYLAQCPSDSSMLPQMAGFPFLDCTIFIYI